LSSSTSMEASVLISSTLLSHIPSISFQVSSLMIWVCAKEWERKNYFAV